MGLSSLGPRRRCLQGTIIQGGRNVDRRRRQFAVLRPNVQVIRNLFGDLLEYGSGNLPTVVALLWLIHHHRNADLGSVRWKEPDERSEVLARKVTGAAAGLLRRAGFSGHGVMLQGRFRRGA